MSGAIIVFGLVSIPCKTSLAAASRAVSFTTVTQEGHRLKSKQFDAENDKEIEKDTTPLFKAYEVAKGKVVPFTTEELESLAAAGQNEVEIKEFVEETSILPYEVEKTYFLAPEPGAEKGYALLASTMLRRKVVAVAQWMQSQREHLVVLKPHRDGTTVGLLCQHMFYRHEVRSFVAAGVDETKARVSPQESGMADKLIEMLFTGGFDSSKYTDNYATRIKEFAAKKLNGEELPKVAATAPRLPAPIDLTALLEQSLAKAGKPAEQPAPAVVEAKPKKVAKKAAAGG
jgi:DNA end-binding protein Ku